VVLPKRIVGCHYSNKTLALESPQAVKVMGTVYIVANCCAKNQNRFKSRCPCGYKGNAIAKGLVLSWMIYGHNFW
jgi:hypothetical protein